MKKRDLIGLVIAIAIISITGVLLYTQLAPAPKDTGISVVVPARVKEPLSDSGDPSDQKKMSSLEQFVDFSIPQKCSDSGSNCGGGPGPI